MSEGWVNQAACLNRDPAWWDYDGGLMTREGRKAIEICGTCPVRDECLRTALEQGHETGIWGGLTPAERQLLTGKRKPSVTKIGDTWQVRLGKQRAEVGSWHAAMSFALRVAG